MYNNNLVMRTLVKSFKKVTILSVFQNFRGVVR